MYFVWYLLLGLASGWIANLIVKGSGSGLIVNLVVGLVGGVLGGWLFSFFGLVPAGTLGSLATSVIGAVVLLWIAAAQRIAATTTRTTRNRHRRSKKLPAKNPRPENNNRREKTDSSIQRAKCADSPHTYRIQHTGQKQDEGGFRRIIQQT